MKKYILSTFLLTSFATNSQVTIHEGIGQKKSSGTNHSNNSKVLKFKFDPLEASFSGTGMVFVEKNLNDLFGVEVGAGITYFSLWNHAIMSESSNISQGDDGNPFFASPVSTNPANLINGYGYNVYSSKNYSHKFGFAASIMPKIYLEEDPTDGMFLGVQLLYKNFNFETPSIDPNKILTQSLNRFNLMGVIGNSVEVSDLFQMEGLLGVGLSFVDDKRNMVYSDVNGIERNGTVTYSPTRFQVMIGTRFTFSIW